MTAMKKFITGLAASMLVATPVMAQADRASAPAPEAEEAFGGGGVLIPILIFAAAIAAMILIADNEDFPVSP